jgi:hypothetical protein
VQTRNEASSQQRGPQLSLNLHSKSTTMRFFILSIVGMLVQTGFAAAANCCYDAPAGGCDVITPEFKLRPVEDVVHPDICCCFGTPANGCSHCVVHLY